MRAAALVVVWSSGFIGADLGAGTAGPDTLLAWRGLATAAVLLPWALRAVGRLDGREWLRQAVLALLCQCLYLGGVFSAAAAGVPAGTSALVAALQPALVVVSAALLSARRLGRAHLAGLVLGTAGVAVTAAGDLRAGTAPAGLLLPLLAMLSLTAGTLLQQRWATPGRVPPPLLQTLAVQAVFAAVSFTAVAGGAGHLAPPAAPAFWAAVAWATAAGIGSYGAYYLVTARDGAARASTLLYLTPAVTALWAAAVLGQPLGVPAVLGLAVSACAVVLLRDPPGRAAVPREPRPAPRTRRPTAVAPGPRPSRRPAPRP
nr:DMT family transporter [Kineococcus siccus]